MDPAIVTDFLPTLALAIALAASADCGHGFLCCSPAAWHAGSAGPRPILPVPRLQQGPDPLRAATAIELIGDKVPAVDHVLDVIGTPLRPAAGALLAASVLGTVSDPLTSVVLGTAVGAPSALVPHVAKSALRVASTAATAGLANPLLSLLEDVISVLTFVIAVLAPIVVIAMLGLTLYLASRWLRRRSATRAA